MILTFPLKRSSPQSNKQAAWHMADSEGEAKWWVWSVALMMLEGGVTLGTLLPALSLFSQDYVLFFSLPVCSSVLVLSLRLWHGQERTAWQSLGGETTGFPLYLCGQQGIKPLLCPGSKPSTGGSSSQDGSSLQGRGGFSYYLCVCRPHCSCLHISCVLLLEVIDYHKGGCLPALAWQKLPQRGSIITFSSLLSCLMEHCFKWSRFIFAWQAVIFSNGI